MGDTGKELQHCNPVIESWALITAAPNRLDLTDLSSCLRAAAAALQEALLVFLFQGKYPQVCFEVAIEQIFL